MVFAKRKSPEDNPTGCLWSSETSSYHWWLLKFD